MGVSALGLRLGPIHPQQDARGWKKRLEAGAGEWSSWQVRLPMLAGSSALGPNPPDSRSAQIWTRQEPLAPLQWTSSWED